MNDIRARVASCFEVALNRPHIADTDFSRETTPEWDSLKNIEIVLLLEDEFSIRFSTSELIQFRSLHEVVELVAAHVKN